MNQLVFVEKNQAVTDSLTVAEVFGKRHADVLRDIKNLGCSSEFTERNFALSDYEDSTGRKHDKWFFTQDGFTLLVMGYTGKEAMKFKESYINQFRKMEEELKRPRVLSEREQLMASMKLSIETAEEITVVKSEVKEIRGMVENQITLDHGEQLRVKKAVATKVYELETNPDIRPALFRELYRDIKDRFGVASYRDIKRKDILAAVRYIEAWIPRMVTQ